MSFSDLDYLRHMRDEAIYLQKASAGLEWTTFMQDETIRRAFVRSLEVIGEAATKVSDDYRAQHLEVEWRSMAGMRNRLIHDYLGVDYEIVWDVA